MSSRSVQMVVLCEDTQHSTFVYRLLKQLGFPRRRIRIEKAPAGGGAAEQYVREVYPDEVCVHRQKRARMKIGLVVVIDADTHSVDDRFGELNDSLISEGMQMRQRGEMICILVPKRNIETWVYALEGDDVDEQTTYPKLERESDCKYAVQRLVDSLRGELPTGVILSLRRGHKELNERLPQGS